jgi:hypothetical protein
MHARIDHAFRLLADLGIDTSIIDTITVFQDWVHIRLNHRDHDTMSPIINASRQLGVAPELYNLNPTTFDAAGRLPLDMEGRILLIGRTNTFAQDEWPEQFAEAFSQAMVLDEMNTAPF